MIDIALLEALPAPLVAVIMVPSGVSVVTVVA